jgi:hypothetical protein
VLGIILVVGGLVWPWILKVREEANRSQCAGNLRQIGISLHNFHDHMSKMPPAIGWLRSKDGPTPPERDAYGNLFFHLLPYVGGDQLYSSTNSAEDRAPTQAPWRANAYATCQRNYVCPSDPTVGTGVSESGFAFGTYAYNGQVFATVDRNGWLTDWYGAARIPESIPDGTSNTFMLAEKLARCDEAGTLWANWEANYWQPGFAIWQIGPSSRYQERENAIQQASCDPLRASTAHSKGIMTCLADASVRLYRSPNDFRGVQWSLNEWWYMTTPAGGERYLSGWDG